jgi:hypothetical protein
MTATIEVSLMYKQIAIAASLTHCGTLHLSSHSITSLALVTTIMKNGVRRLHYQGDRREKAKSKARK